MISRTGAFSSVSLHSQPTQQPFVSPGVSSSPIQLMMKEDTYSHLLKSVLKKTPCDSSAVSSFRHREDYSSVAVNLKDGLEFREAPSFWKDHNVQVLLTVLGF